MVNRNVTLYSMLLDMWARDLNVADTLHYCTIMGFSRCVVEPQIKPTFNKLTADYAAVMEAEAKHAEQYPLWNADPNCVHDEQPASGGGVKCRKCSGWFCF